MVAERVQRWHILPAGSCNFYQNTLQRLLNKRNQLFI
jgi:hypothetical protein